MFEADHDTLAPTCRCCPRRRKLRMSGVRAQLVVAPAEPMPTSPPPAAPTPAAATRLVIHATPLRCSRALALRHLAARYRQPLGPAWTLVAFAGPAPGGSSGTAARAGGSTGAVGGSTGAAPATPPVLSLRASDAEDLVGGVQRVVLLPHAAPTTPVSADTPAEGAAAPAAAAATPPRSAAPSPSSPALSFPVEVAAFQPAALALGQVGAQWPGDKRVVVVQP
jgi:hypothetical protein